MIAHALENWFAVVKRPMPWRKKPTPYVCWLSEIMMQQTTYAAVLPYYERFLGKFPTVEKLAAAKEGEVLKVWEGLGYYARARNLLKAARQIVGTQGGRDIPVASNNRSGSSVATGMSRPLCRSGSSVATGMSRPLCRSGSSVATGMSRPLCRSGSSAATGMSRPLCRSGSSVATGMSRPLCRTGSSAATGMSRPLCRSGSSAATGMSRPLCRSGSSAATGMSRPLCRSGSSAATGISCPICWPVTSAEWAQIPGVGPYTAAALSSVLSGERVPVVDGNVARVFARVWKLDDDFSKLPARAKLAERLQPEIDKCRVPGDFNQAMMELGALVCTPKSPDCAKCPLAKMCAAKKDGSWADYPVKKGKKELPVRKMMSVIIKDAKGRVLLVQNREGGLLKGLWELPTVEQVADVTQVFSHFKLEQKNFTAGRTDAEFRDPKKVPLTTATRKALRLA